MNRDPLGYALIGAAYDVYNKMGSGFLEEIYRECLEIELAKKKISCEREVAIPVFYDGVELQKKYRADLIINGELLVELKAVSALCPEHYGQLINYLHATQIPVGYLINFGKTDELEWKRMTISQQISENKRG